MFAYLLCYRENQCYYSRKAEVHSSIQAGQTRRFVEFCFRIIA